MKVVIVLNDKIFLSCFGFGFDLALFYLLSRRGKAIKRKDKKQQSKKEKKPVNYWATLNSHMHCKPTSDWFLEMEVC